MGQFLEIYVLFQYVVDFGRKILNGDIRVGVIAQQVGHLVHFRDYRRHTEIGEYPEEDHRFEEGNEYGGYSPLQM